MLAARQVWLPRLALLAALALLAVSALHTVWAVDAGWQLATGRYVAASGPPQVDVLSLAGEGRPWIELRWLYCLALFEVVSRFGWPAAVALKAALVVAAFAIVAEVGGGRRRPVLAGALVGLAAVGAGERLMLRPEILSFVFLAVELAVLERFRRTADWRWLAVLPPLQVLWTNCHTTFILGPVVLGLFLAGELWRRRVAASAAPGQACGVSPAPVAAALAATTLACLVNPWGIRGLLFPWQLWRQIHAGPLKDEILEFQGSLVYWRVSPAVWAAAALAAVCVLVAVRRGGRRDPFWTLLCAAFLYLAVVAVRNLPLFCLVAVPFVLLSIPAGAAGGGTPRARLAAALGALAVVAGCGWVGWQRVTDRWQAERDDAPQFGWRLASHRFPEAAADLLLRRGLAEEPVFATFKESSYLLARGFKVLIDPRLEVFGEELLARHFATLRDPASLERSLAASGVRVAVLDLSSGLVSGLRSGGRWRLLHLDATAAVLVHHELPAASAAILDRAAFAAAAEAVARTLGPPRPYAATPWWRRVPRAAPYRRTASFLARVGYPDLAEPFAAWARAAAPGADAGAAP